MAVTTVRQIAGEVAALARDDGVAGRYLTDGRDLFRVLGSLDVPGAAAEVIAIEDCRTLDLVLVAPRELEGWEMRPVTASAS